MITIMKWHADICPHFRFRTSSCHKTKEEMKTITIHDLKQRYENKTLDTERPLARTMKKRLFALRTQDKRVTLKIAALEDRLSSLKDRIDQARMMQEHSIEKGLSQKKAQVSKTIQKLEQDHIAILRDKAELSAMHYELKKNLKPKKPQISNLLNILMTGGSSRNNIRGHQEIQVARRVNI